MVDRYIVVFRIFLLEVYEPGLAFVRFISAHQIRSL